MNSHTPILLRDLDIYHDILFDFYLRADSVDGFVGQIQKLKENPEYYRTAVEMSARGHAFYSRENVAKMWRNFYHEILSKGPAKRRRKPAGARGKVRTESAAQ